MRVALLTNILSPYRVPVFEALATTPGWKLRILVNARTEFDRSWCVDAGNLDVRVVRSCSVRRRIPTGGRAATVQTATTHIPIGLLAALVRFRPDVVVSGELGLRSLLALVYCRLARVPLVIWSYHSSAGHAGATPLRLRLSRLLLARADAVIGMGTQTRDVLGKLGVPDALIFDAPNAHDDDTAQRALAESNPLAMRATLREAHGCRPRIALVAGRLIPVKGIEPLLARWEGLPETLRKSWTLLFLGSGPLEPQIRDTAARCAPGEVICLPEVTADAIYDHYSVADLLIFPSLGDNWGLAVAEAFACGLPVLCSQLAGCSDDLLRPGENGWTFDPTSRADFDRALRAALESDQLAELGANARDSVKPFSSAAMAEGMRRAVGFVSGASPSRLKIGGPGG